eukprot:6196806-Pleurochrysis_carterae.AAC.1
MFMNNVFLCSLALTFEQRQRSVSAGIGCCGSSNSLSLAHISEARTFITQGPDRFRSLEIKRNKCRGCILIRSRTSQAACPCARQLRLFGYVDAKGKAVR